MPTRITEIETPPNGATLSHLSPARYQIEDLDHVDATKGNGRQPSVFKVEGSLYLRDAELLERICRSVSLQRGRPLLLDLSELCFLDSDSAAILCRMKREQGVELEGLNLFIKKVIELAEESEKVAKYLK